MAAVAISWQKLLNAGMVVQAFHMLHAGRVRPDPRWAMSSHAHDFHELVVILRGAMRVSGPGLNGDCREGDVLLYPAGIVHDERSDPDDPVESIFVSFRGKNLGSRSLVRFPDRRGRVREMARWLYEDRLSTDSGRLASLDTLGAALFAELSAAAEDEADPLVEETRAWVLRHLGEPLSLEALARHAGLSRCHYLRRYKRAAGRTPMQDVRAIRVDHARGLLLGTGLTLKEIAPLAGLGDEYSLSRMFRRMLGVSARSLRRFHGGRRSSAHEEVHAR
jgi:AraC-like DNA-binding protein/mannose-6-phosphate isomerase-like protein (cupin superfamily)